MTELFQNLMDPAWIVAHGGLYIVMLIVFAETGLLIGFFLPGDSLLFVAGMIIANSIMPGSSALWVLGYWLLLIAISGIVGNYLGYWIGKRSGPVLFERRDAWLFKKRHLQQAQEFYEKRGGGAIVIARFLPVVRTFAPVVAGIVGMNPARFGIYNIIGSMVWVGSIVTAGFLLGENAWAQLNLDKIIIGIVVVTTSPVIVKMVLGKKKIA